jgi:hypothetical protein
VTKETKVFWFFFSKKNKSFFLEMAKTMCHFIPKCERNSRRQFCSEEMKQKTFISRLPQHPQ